MSRSGKFRALHPAPIAAAVALISLCLLLPGLGQHGFSSVHEIPVANRAESELGAIHFDMLRSPWLPDQIRAWSLQLFAWPMENAPVEWALRLPGSLFSALIVGLTAALSYFQRRQRWHMLLAGGLALSCPALLSQARTLSGNPIGESLVAFTILSLLFATSVDATKPIRIIGFVFSFLGMIAGTVSCGLAFAVAFPMLVVALSSSTGTPKRWLWAATLGFLAVALVCAYLIYHQSGGFLPILGAARAPSNSNPLPNFLESVVQTTYAVFPWAPLLLAGILVPSPHRWPVMWLGASMLADAIWTFLYGFTPISIVVPACLVAAQVVDRCLSAQTPARERRLLCFVSLLGFYLVTKEITRSPDQLYWPLERWATSLPEIEPLPQNDVLIESIVQWALWGMVGAYCLSHASIPGFLLQTAALKLKNFFSTFQILRPPRSLYLWLLNRSSLSHLVLIVIALVQLNTYGYELIYRNGTQTSIRNPLSKLEQWVNNGELENTVGLLSQEDPGLPRYLPKSISIRELSSRYELAAWLTQSDRRSALIEQDDYPAIYQQIRNRKGFIAILDQQHQRHRLIANHLPEGAENYDPLPTIVLSEPPDLENTTLINYGGVVELLGWEIESPVIRGSNATLKLALRVLSRCPSGLEIFARLQKGKLSRLNVQPFKPAEGKYPPNYWKKGDIIVQRRTFPVSPLTSLPGVHEIFVAIRRSPRKNLKIKVPLDGFSDPIHLRGKKEEFAVIGEIPIH